MSEVPTPSMDEVMNKDVARTRRLVQLVREAVDLPVIVEGLRL